MRYCSLAATEETTVTRATHTHTHTHAHRHTQRHTQKHTHTEIHTRTEIHTHRDTHTHTHTGAAELAALDLGDALVCEAAWGRAAGPAGLDGVGAQEVSEPLHAAVAHKGVLGQVADG